jgi:hypothetical protein
MADGAGGVLPGVTVTIEIGRLRRSVVSDSQGEFTFSGLPAGEAVLTAELAGFTTRRATFVFDGNPRRAELDMELGTITETVTVMGLSELERTDKDRAEKAVVQMAAPSQNVVNLQARASGVLPIRVEVPRAGVSHQFVKPLVVGTEATVKLRYKRN